MMLHHVYLNCELKQFLKLKKVIVLPYLSYSKYLDLCYLFPCFFLSGRHYKSRKALASAISQCLNGLSKSAYRDAFHIWSEKLCIKIREEYLKAMRCAFHYLSRMHLRNHKIYTYTYRTTIVCFACPKGRIENILFAYGFSDVLFDKN